MPHHYKNIFGWMDYEFIYDTAVEEYDNCCFIETGNFLGRSAIYMAERIKESGKNITLICVDLFCTPSELKRWENSGGGQGEEFSRLMELKDGHLNTFVQNLYDAGVDDVIIPVKASTHKAIRLLEGRTYPFIFIDSGHGYDTVLKDLELYWPITSEFGTLSGHDYGDIGVNKAVHDYFDPKGIPVERVGGSWRVRKQNVTTNQ